MSQLKNNYKYARYRVTTHCSVTKITSYKEPAMDKSI